MKNESKPKKTRTSKPKGKGKGTRFDSVSAQTEIAQAAHDEIQIPNHIRMDEGHMPFFRSIMAEYAKAIWTSHMIEVACILARTMKQMEHEQYMLEMEGAVSKSDRGTPVVNPRKTVVQMCAGTIFSLRRTLGIHARAQMGESRDVGKRTKAQKELENRIIGDEGDDDDDLIARPVMN